MDSVLLERRAEILETAQRHGAHNVRVFGSASRGEAGARSDVDFLVEFDEGRSLLDLTALSQDLEEILDRRVDLVEPEGLHWFIRERILNEALPL